MTFHAQGNKSPIYKVATKTLMVEGQQSRSLILSNDLELETSGNTYVHTYKRFQSEEQWSLVQGLNTLTKFISNI